MIIYKVTNLVNNKIYIGQTIKTLKERIKNHVRESKNKNIYRPFLLALKKYGLENFLFEEIDNADSLNELDKKEIYWINLYDSTNKEKGYNISFGGQSYEYNNTFGKLISEGLKRSKKWQEYKKTDKYKEQLKNFFCVKKGEKLSNEHKEKIWKSNKERILKQNYDTAKEWIIIDKDNNIIKVKSKDLFFNNINIDSSMFTRMAQKLEKNQNCKRIYDFYCFYDNKQTNEEILKKVNDLDNHYKNINTKYTLLNELTNEIIEVFKSNLNEFCQSRNLDYSNMLKVVKGKSKSYRKWVLVP
jgi:group I intron endonuclease